MKSDTGAGFVFLKIVLARSGARSFARPDTVVAVIRILLRCGWLIAAPVWIVTSGLLGGPIIGAGGSGSAER